MAKDLLSKYKYRAVHFFKLQIELQLLLSNLIGIMSPISPQIKNLKLFNY